MSHQTKGMIRDTLSYKGIEQFDYLVATQQDTLIDKDRLAEGFLKMHEKLGLLLDEEEPVSYTHLTLPTIYSV